jgi:antitoxin component YwqK of YwqJK toxin-antitoxin module
MIKVYLYSLILMLFSFINQANGQKKELSTDYYGIGHLHWKGYDTCVTSVQNGKEFTTCSPIGFWEYWYEDGAKQLETFETLNGSNYTNMWLQNGKQILTDGEGFYYQIEPYGNGKNDSLVYQITKGVKHGKFMRYRSYEKNSYFLAGTGQYENKKKSGLWIYRDSTIKFHSEIFYVDDEENGISKLFYINGSLKEVGQKTNAKKDGLWKYYDENGKLIKECNFKSNELFGRYNEYYTNGQVKILGQYIHVKGFETIYLTDAFTGKRKKQRLKSDNIVAKDGEWINYDEKGQIIKKETYKKKVVTSQ